MSYSKGEINKIERYQFSYNASTLPGSSGSPIFLIQTTYVIGIHKGGDENEKENYGDLLFPIINFIKKENEIKIIIEFKCGNYFFLFGKEFIKNNNDKCEVIINGKNGFDLNCLSREFGDLSKTYEIILKEIKEITDMSFMLCNNIYYKIIQIDFSKWNVSNVTNMKYMFRSCYNIYGISKWDVSNVKDMSFMFWGCKNIPDISKWDVSNVKDMSYMFSGSENIPDISKWDISNVKDMSYMFSYCKNIPDISKWDVSNVKDMSYMFNECKNIPDISEWDVSNVNDMSYMFNECECINIPDISKWNVSNLTNITGMFYNCVYLTSLPDISNWDISNVKNISKIFDECKSLKSLPDISIIKIIT